MPNNQPLEDIISESSKKSILDAQANSEKLNKTLQETIVLRKQLNDTMVGAKTMGDVNAIAVKEQKAIEQTNILMLRKQKLQTEIAAKEQAIELKRAEAEAKRLASEQKQIDAIKKKTAVVVAEAEKERQAMIKLNAEVERKNAREFKFANDADSNGKTIVTGTTINSDNLQAANAANAANAIEGQTQAIQKNTGAKKLSNLEQEKANQLAKIDRLNLVAQAKEGNAVKGSLEQRQLALARLKKTYTSLSNEERNSPFGKRLGTVIPQLNQQVLGLEKSLGKSQRDVGNYGNAFVRTGQKAFGALRTIANILPGLGIGGLIGILAEPIIEAISKLDIFKAKIETTAKAVAASSSEYKKANADVTALGTSISEFNNGTISKKELVDRFNDSIGQTVGKLTTAGQVEAFYNKQAAAFVTATLMRAEANAALELSTQKTTEALERQVNGPTLLDYAKGIGLSIAQVRTLSIESIKFNALTAKNEGVASLRDSSKEFAKLYDGLKKKADEFAKSNGLNFNPEKDIKGKKLPDPAIQARKNAAALLQVQIELAKEEADIYKSQMDNLNYSLETRLDSQLKYEEQLGKISKLEADKSKAEKKNSKQQIEAIEAKSQKEVSKLTREGVETRLKIIKEEADEAEKVRLTAAERILTNIEKQRDEELIEVKKQYANGIISLEEFEKKKLDVSKKYALIEVAEQIKQAETLIEIQKAAGIDTTDAEAKLTAIKLKRLSLITDATKEENEKQKQSEKEKFETIKELANETFEFSRSLITGTFEANISNLEEEIRVRELKKNRDIEGINESILSEQEKANQISLINAKAEQDQQVIETRVREQKRKQAIADKAFALTQIAINTAVAVSKVLGQTGIFGLAASIPVIALGAIQAATVLAQPIPKFAKGGVMQKDGLAEYGHGTELRINPDGKTSLTSDKPEIGFVQKGTRFISAPETKRLMAKPDSLDVAGKSWDVAPLIAESQRSTKEIKKALGMVAQKNKKSSRNFDMVSFREHLKRNGF